MTMYAISMSSWFFFLGTQCFCCENSGSVDDDAGVTDDAGAVEVVGISSPECGYVAVVEEFVEGYPVGLFHFSHVVVLLIVCGGV